ncbi:glycosyltransferase [uncultured Microbacterium sp.]|uniref:glycosyltransferase n=1 Tax=uncultured Microbacterium sp. TaxID=191216 RepID=UPI003749E316
MNTLIALIGSLPPVFATVPAPGEPGPVLTPQPEQSPAQQAPAVVVPTDTGFALPSWTPLEWVGYSSLVLLSLALTAIAVTTLWWMLHAWRSDGHLSRTAFAAESKPAHLSFTLLVPGRHEEEVMGQTLDTLAQQDHPDFEIIAIVGHDDPGTEAVARAAAARHPHLIKVVVDDSVPKNKPKALNRALKVSRGDVVGVFDAEDEVHPRLLSLVDTKFADTGADVVQGGVQLMNFRSSWWSLRNVLEYYFWFRSRLHFQAETGFIPLGGNTVFAKREWLDWSDGWDENCLAEDCELGVRFSSAGAKIVVAYSPEVATREETPGTLKSLYKQRTRWNQGFLQVLRKGEWRKLPTLRQRLFARYLLAMPFLQAATGLVIPLSIVLILFIKVPTPIALLSFLPLAPTLVTIAVEIAGLGEFGRVYSIKPRARDYVRLVLGTFPYQVFLALASVRSVVRQIRGINSWEKTEHSNLHRDATPAASVSATSEPDSADLPVLVSGGAR